MSKVVEAISISADGTLDYPLLQGNTLLAMYREIGCDTVDCVKLADTGIDMWVDDNGMYDAPVNVTGTQVVSELLKGTSYELRQQFYGTLLFTGRSDDDTVSISVANRMTVAGIHSQLTGD